MAVGRLGKGIIKRPPKLGFAAKVSLVALLGLSFIVIWLTFSSPSSSVSSTRSSFDEIETPAGKKKGGSAAQHSRTNSSSAHSRPHRKEHPAPKKKGGEKKEKKESKGTQEGSARKILPGDAGNENDGSKDEKIEEEEERDAVDNTEAAGEGDEKKEIEEVTDLEGEADNGLDGDVDTDANADEEVPAADKEGRKNKGEKKSGPLFDPNAYYDWKLCSGRTGQNYIPCVDLEGTASGKLQSHRHHERSCPAAPPMCLTPLPQGYESPITWPESQSKIFYRNVAHPKLSSFIKAQSWLKLSGDYLTFPKNESVFKGGTAQYLDFISEMVPDIDWGKNIRVVLDVGSTDDSFGISLLEKDVLTLSLGLMNGETDLAQVSLERGLAAVVGSLRRRRLPFPSGVFDAIHCGECSIPWHSNGGKLLVEMNRVLRPGGYFLVSFRQGDIESEEAMSKLTTSICWNVLAHKTDEETDLGVKIYQRPSSNDIYELRRTKNPPLCAESENQDAAWYTPIKTCLHKIPASIEQRGTDWPEEWPTRLDKFPDWLADSQEKLVLDTEHWKAVVNKSYLNGMGIDWSHIRNVMDMKAIYGGFAAALASQKVWVMNVVPVHAPNTLPIIYERGLLGIYHDWCESFSTYPRSYDLLHADHLFSRLKNRCKHPMGIVVEMDRILRPGGWAIIRDKLEILNPLEAILKSLHWEIRMTYSQNNQGIICVQKTTWRP